MAIARSECGWERRKSATGRARRESAVLHRLVAGWEAYCSHLHELHWQRVSTRRYVRPRRRGNKAIRGLQRQAGLVACLGSGWPANLHSVSVRAEAVFAENADWGRLISGRRVL